MDDYYKDKKFKPGDVVFYNSSENTPIIGEVVGLEKANRMYLQFTKTATASSIIFTNRHKINHAPIFCIWDRNKEIGWMPESELLLLTEAAQLLYRKEE
jgi:hypothetical protein